jgi:CPA1 family monovalent cation:H+ antiporter
MELRIERIELLLLIASVVAMLARRLHLPYTVGLTVAGIVAAVSGIELHVELTKDLIFVVFLPPLIFEAALQMKWSSLRDNAWVVSVLATVGVLIASGITAAGLHYIIAWPWATAIPVGVLISATDPVSVIATFKEAGVTGRLRLLVEAESLFNDGTVAVLFGVALSVTTGAAVTMEDVAGNFLLTVLGGIFCGAVIGGTMLFVAGRTNDHLVEITFSTIAAYGSFLVADHLHLSGVLATLTAGVLIGNTASLGAFSEKGLAAVESFWEYIGFIANSLIFLLIGVRIVSQHVVNDLTIGLLLIALVLAGRAIAVYACCAAFFPSRHRVSLKHQHLLVWGGLRGALALALALGLPASITERNSAISVIFIVVAFSILIQGLTMTPLLKYLGELHPAAKRKSP